MSANKDVQSISDSGQLVQRLADVEILYLLSLQPLELNNLVRTLRTTFEYSTVKGTVSQLLASLEAEGLVASFRKEATELGNSCSELFGITPTGLKLLRVHVESISGMALTMQLGYNQKLVRG
ncbi:MAG: hypothetical protein JRN20_04875 [Nitrososphaerota archaeon]|nr:hypothetical protein [Nitrososphaerota archaeon]